MTPDKRIDLANLLNRITPYDYAYDPNLDCIVIHATQDEIATFKANYSLNSKDILYECADPKRKAVKVYDTFAGFCLWNWIRETEIDLQQAKQLHEAIKTEEDPWNS